MSNKKKSCMQNPGEAPVSGSKKTGALHAFSLLSLLQAMSWHYQTCHWLSKGSLSYQDHLLFERLYGGIGGEIDALAEKIVALFGDEGVDPISSMKKSFQWMQEFSRQEDMFSASAHAEDLLQSFLQKAYDALEAEGLLTMGLDNFLMAIADVHETNQYLLKQRGA